MAATPEEMTDGERDALVRAALAGLGRGTLRAALQEAGAPRLPIPTPAANALATLRRHRDPASVIDRPQYRAALPYAVAVVSQECLEAVVDALGDHADDPTAEQLEAALDAVAPTFDDATVRVMLASVAIDEMPASGLCLALLDGDGRYGLGEWRSGAAPVEAAGPSAGPGPAGASEEVRAERRARKQREAEERRKQAEDRARAAAQVREAQIGRASCRERV